MKQRGGPEDTLAKSILEYFLRNPSASDDLEGIAHWRLLDQVVRHAVKDARGAVELLVARGYLKKITIGGSRHHYCLNTENREAAETFLGGEASEGEKEPKP